MLSVMLGYWLEDVALGFLIWLGASAFLGEIQA
jgi:hypothetical protein